MLDYLPLLITWLIAVFKDASDLFSREVVRLGPYRIERRLLTWMVVALLTISSVLAGIKLRDAELAARGIRPEPFAKMENLTEASGAVAVDSRAFVVADERDEGVFELHWNGSKYDTATPCTISQDERTVAPNDLEAIALAPSNRHLWLLTSHSNTEEGKPGRDRRMLLEVAFDAEASGACALTVTRGPVDLRPAMLAALATTPELSEAAKSPTSCDERKRVPGCGTQNHDETYSVLHAEGLAVDRAGRFAYVALRSPLVTKNGPREAVVLRTPVEALFSGQPSFEVLPVPIRFGQDSYGIASLDRLPESDQLVMVGVSADKLRVQAPVVCTWTPAQPGAPVLAPNCKALPRFSDPVPWARPESLAFAPDGRVVLFLDGDDRSYGQVLLPRDAVGL